MKYIHLGLVCVCVLQSVQAKQTALLKRVDTLDEECEELQKQLGESEQRQIDLHNQLQQNSEEKEQVQAQLTQKQVDWKCLTPNMTKLYNQVYRSQAF